MAFADLGVRIILEDGARAGFDALSLSIFNTFTRTGELSAMWSKLNPLTQTAGIVAGVSGLAFGGLSGLLWECISAAAQLQQEMANMSVSVNGASAAGDALTNTLVSLADNSIYTTATIADGFTTLGVDGWNAQQLIDGMGQAMVQFAEASRSEVIPAANLLGTTMETYGASANDAKQYTNDLTFALYNGQKTVANLQAAFNQVGSTAHGLNVPFGELADALALLGEDGLKGTQAGSALRYMLTSLADPTNKALTELAALGVVVINKDTPAFHDFRDSLLASGGAAAKSAEMYDGTLGSLKKMFDQAKAIGLIHTDKTFLEWASATGILSDKLYDAQGNFVGIKGTIDALGSAISNMNPEQKAQAIQQLFNVRGSQAAKLLLQNYLDTLQKFGNLDAIRQGTDVTKKADEVINTLQGDIKRLGSTWQDTMARLGNIDLGPLQGLFTWVSNLLDKFNTAPASTRNFVGQLLALATAALGVTFAISGGVFLVGAFASSFGKLGTTIAQGAGIFGKFAMGILQGIIPALTGFSDGVWSVVGFIGKLAGPLASVGGWFKGLWTILFQTGVNWSALGTTLAGFWSSVSGFFASIGPAITGFIANAGGMAGIMSTLDTAIATAAGAIGTALAPILAIVGAILLVAGVVYGVIAAFQHWWTTSAKFRTIITDLWKQIQGLGTLLMGQFKQAWAAIQQQIQNLQPLLGQLKEVWQTIQPVLMIIGGIIIGVVVVAIGVLVGALKGIISAIGPLLSGIIGFIGGLVQILMGAVQIIVGIFQILVGIVKGIFTGDWTTLGDGLKKLGQGVLNILNGLATAIWSLLSGVVTAVVSLIANFIGGIIGFFKHLFETLVGHSIVTDLVKAIMRLFTMMHTVVTSIIHAFVTAAIALFNLFKAGVTLVVHAVTAVLQLLIKGLLIIVHAISSQIIMPMIALFQMIVAAVMVIVASVIKFFTQLRDAVLQVVLGLVNGITTRFTAFVALVIAIVLHLYNEAVARFNLIKDAVVAVVVALWTRITTAFTNAKNMVTSKITEIKNTAVAIWTNLTTMLHDKIQDAWNRVITAFNNAKSLVTSKINDIKNSVLTPIQNLGQQLFDSAKNAMQMFINGLDAMIGKLKSKLGDIANSVKNFLGFHSPTKEGPLADSDTYMPNMMKMFAGGIDKHKALVGNAASGVASHIGKTLGNISPTAGINATGSIMTNAMMASKQASLNTAGGNGGVNQTITVPLQVDGQTLSTVVLKQVGNQLSLNGIGRQLR